MSKQPSRRQRKEEAIDRLIRKHTASDGEIDRAAVRADLAALYRVEPDLLADAEQCAHDDLEQYLEDRRPFRVVPGGLQVALPLNDRLIPFGQDKEIKLGRARRQHLLAWRVILQEEMTRSQIAFVRKITMIDEALGRMGGDDDTFGDVMGKDDGGGGK